MAGARALVPGSRVAGRAVTVRLGPGRPDLAPRAGDRMRSEHLFQAVEAMRPGDRQQFGFERVEHAVLECASLGPDAVVKGVLEAVSRWTSGPAQDDETLLVIGRSATAEAAESPTPFSVHDLMALAESYGNPAPPIASLADLGALRGWMSEHGIMGSLPDPSRRRIELGLYEMCANVIEHGYRRNENAALDLWWVPDDPALGAGRSGDGPPPAAGAGARTGYFVLRDHGRPFDPGRGPTPDLRDAATRRTGRGLGLEMARRILSRLRYYPNSPHGNLTLMRFDNDSATEGDHV